MARFFTLFFVLTGVMYSLVAFCQKEMNSFRLAANDAELIIDAKNDLIIKDLKKQINYVNTSVANLWEIKLINNLNHSEIILRPDNFTFLQYDVNKLIINEDYQLNLNGDLNLEVKIIISVVNNAFYFSGDLKNKSSEWQIESLVFPTITAVKASDKISTVYWPNSLGEKFDNPVKFGNRSFKYPSTKGSMAWYTINDEQSGIYIASHDLQQGAKEFSLNYNSQDETFKAHLNFPVNSNDFTIPAVVIKPYKGTWHEAARYYRYWYDTHFELVSTPTWLRENAGLMLVILKQQNGNVMWTYNDIDHLCDIGERLNIKLIGLWGWAVGGHDRLYPNYMPDNLLGGRLVLERAIKRAHERGFKIIVYSNGTIMDTSTDFYRYNGRETLFLDQRKQPDIDFFLKHNNSTPVVFAKACPGSKVWRRTIEQVALNSQSLGIDAFYIDQVGVREPLQCYSDYHDHTLPQEAYTKYRLQMMTDIRKSLLKSDPQFGLMTEGTVDVLMSAVDVFHGLGPGSIITPDAFPAMFRYTFPESIIIQLNPNPVVPRYEANYATVFGLRHEIMSRYQADADYLTKEKIPVKQDYITVNYPPDIDKIRTADKKEAINYSFELIQFENDHAKFFRTGKFIDEEGIVVNGEDILAKGFKNGNMLGVVVWNQNLEDSKNYRITVPGYELKDASEPGIREVNQEDSLAANSIRLLIYEEL